MEGVDIVIHAAGLKHVALCERAPRAAMQTNIIGTQNVIQAALAAGVERVLLTSSDKAVNPTNVMGTSKLMAERLMTAANMRAPQRPDDFRLQPVRQRTGLARLGDPFSSSRSPAEDL